MARAYSDDLRRKVLSAYGAGKGTMRELAERFDVSYGWVLKIAAAQRQLQAGATASCCQPHRCRTDPAAGRGATGHRSGGVAAEGRRAGRAGQHLASVAYPRQARSAAQKKSLHASERDTEENRQRRKIHLQTIGSIPPEDLIYVDEDGVSTQMTRLYGRARKRQRIRDRIWTAGSQSRMTTISVSVEKFISYRDILSMD